MSGGCASVSSWKSAQDEIYPVQGDLMARREITEAGQQRLDRYKQRRDEYLRKLAHLAPPLSEEQKARLAVLLALAVEEYRRRKTP